MNSAKGMTCPVGQFGIVLPTRAARACSRKGTRCCAGCLITPALLDLVNKMPDVVVADRAYDLDELRDEFAERTSKLLAPHRSHRKKPPRDQEQIGRHYKQRWRVERLFTWLVGWRRLATRWEADPLNYNTWVCLATSLIYVRSGLLP